MKRRTVLVLPAWYPTARQPLSGPFVRDHARAAAAYGHNVVVVVEDGPSRSVRGLFELAMKEDGDLTVVLVRHRPRTLRIAYLSAVIAVARRLAHAGTPVDLLHAHIHGMGWPAVLAGTILRRPVVISENSSEWPRGMISRGALWRAKIAFRRAALVCPVNERLQHAIQGYGLRARFRVVPNTVDVRTFFPGTTTARPEGVRLINVALHVEVKALDVLLRAFAQAAAGRPELTLDLVGDGPLTGQLRELAAELRVADRVQFRGRLTPPEVAHALRDSDVFVLASLSENMPLGVLEALCCGLPVIATDVGGVSEAVGGDGVLVPVGNAEALARAIEEVVLRYPRFDRGDIAARAAARYSLEAVGRLWDEIYGSL